MNIFELLFILLFITSILILALAALSAIRGCMAHSIAILKAYGTGLATYFGIVILASLVLPPRIFKFGEQLRFDDWCIIVERIDCKASQSGTTYIANLRLLNQAQRATQRENNLVVYLRDNRGIRYYPIMEPSSIPFSVLLHPMESVYAPRTFKLPPNTAASVLVIDHEGGFQIDWLIIGGGPFRKKSIVRLNEK